MARPGEVADRDGRGFVSGLNTFDYTEVAFRSRAECLKRFLVCVAFVSCEGTIVGIELDQNRTFLQSGFMSLNLARGPGQKASAE